MCCNASFIQSPGSLLFDGIFEMFSKSSYVAWAAEAKNGGLSSTVAGRKWDAAFNKEGAITDKLGETKEEMNRVAMKVADRITLRDAHIRARGYTVSTPHERSGYATLSSPRPNEVGMAEWRADSPWTSGSSCGFSLCVSCTRPYPSTLACSLLMWGNAAYVPIVVGLAARSH